MVQDNAELTLRIKDAFNRRDIDGFLALTSNDAELMPYEVAVQGGEPYRGHDGVRQWIEESLAVFPDLYNQTIDARAVGERGVFTHGRLRGQGADSGAGFERDVFDASEWRDGKLIWWQAFDSEAEALEAARARG